VYLWIVDLGFIPDLLVLLNPLHRQPNLKCGESFGIVLFDQKALCQYHLSRLESGLSFLDKPVVKSRWMNKGIIGFTNLKLLETDHQHTTTTAPMALLFVCTMWPPLLLLLALLLPDNATAQQVGDTIWYGIILLLWPFHVNLSIVFPMHYSRSKIHH
jgi:hypothetical protein